MKKLALCALLAIPSFVVGASVHNHPSFNGLDCKNDKFYGQIMCTDRMAFMSLNFADYETGGQPACNVAINLNEDGSAYLQYINPKNKKEHYVMSLATLGKMVREYEASQHE